MTRGSLPEENLDDRTWQDIVNQAQALVPRYTSEWTDLGPGDLGVTLIELFAWLVEGMTYRLNRVPDRSFLTMLNLLGVTVNPQRPATTLLTFTPLPGASPMVPARFSVSTLQTETAPAIVFETDSPLQVQPSNLRFAFMSGPVAAGTAARDAPATDVTSSIAGSPLGGLNLPLKAGQTARLVVGFDTPLTGPFTLEVGVTPPLLPPSKPTDWPTTLWFLSSTSTTTPKGWVPLGGPPASDGTNGLRQSGPITFAAISPLTWTQRKGSDVLTFDPKAQASPALGQNLWWLAVEVTAAPTVDFASSIDSVLFNTVSASHVLTVASEALTNADGGTSSTGVPWQRFLFKNLPLYREPATRTPYDHVSIFVGDSATTPGTLWTLVDDFTPGPSTCYRLNPVTGTVLFGNNDGTAKSTGAGLIPPKGDVVFANYRAASGGTTGNVAPGVLRILQGKLDGVQAVTNLGPGKGGADEESLDDAKRRAPDLLRIRNRAVTVEDYQALALEASTLVAKVSALPTRSDWTVWDGKGGLSRVPGMVNVLIVPNAPNDPQPSPTQDLIQEVHDYLADRSPVAGALTVLGPRYRAVKVTASVKLYPGPRQDAAALTQLQTDLRAAATSYLHPLTGGPNGQGWNIGQGLLVHGLYAALQALVGDSGLIQTLTVALNPPRPAGEVGLDTSGLDNAVGLAMLEYELLCSDVQDAIVVAYFS